MIEDLHIPVPEIPSVIVHVAEPHRLASLGVAVDGRLAVLNGLCIVPSVSISDSTAHVPQRERRFEPYVSYKTSCMFFKREKCWHGPCDDYLRILDESIWHSSCKISFSTLSLMA
jgi:hypothetical protein